MLSLENHHRVSSFEKSNLRRLAEREKLTLQTVLQSSVRAEDWTKILTHFLENLETDDWGEAQTAGWQQWGSSGGTAELQINLLFTVHSPSLTLSSLFWSTFKVQGQLVFDKADNQGWFDIKELIKGQIKSHVGAQIKSHINQVPSSHTYKVR